MTSTHGIQGFYEDYQGRTVCADEKTLLRLAELIFSSKDSLSPPQMMDPVLICDGVSPILISLSFDQSEAGTQIQIFLEHEGNIINESFEWRVNANNLKVKYALPLKRTLNYGYHHLTLRTINRQEKSLLICAPPSLSVHSKPEWGVMSPTYALRSKLDWGIGGLRELESAQDFIWKSGGHFFGTLPLLATSAGSPGGDPSPYSPLSRLFWNEMYLDVFSLTQEAGVEKALSFLRESSFQRELERLRSLPQVDYPCVWALMKKILEPLTEAFFNQGSERSLDFIKFLDQSPEAHAYATFRSQTEAEVRLHLYAQFQINLTLERLAHKASAGKTAGLFLDFPVGVHPESFDCKHFPEAFLLNASAGAPPDLFFEGGQNWGFNPFHPKTLRESGYSYFIKSLRNQMRVSKILRLDHVMGLHRMYVIPQGMPTTQGAYIEYRPSELYAIICLEAKRNACDVVGEDLGTVAPAVRQAMEKKAFKRLWVVQLELLGEDVKAALQPPQNSLVCLNTHDLAPWASFLELSDLERLTKLKLLQKSSKDKLSAERVAMLSRLEKYVGLKWDGLILKLAQSKAKYLLLNIEDIWGETEPQNIPGTQHQYPNWKKRINYALDLWKTLPSWSSVLRSIAHRKEETHHEI